MNIENDLTRFKSKIIICKNDCWEWKAGLTAKGYGTFLMGRKVHLAHRASWRLHKGEIPDGLKILHRCDNKKCVNPNHLFLGTHADNMADKFSKGRQAKGEQHGNHKLTDEKVRIIKQLLLNGNSKNSIATRFEVSVVTICFIDQGKRWRHVV